MPHDSVQDPPKAGSDPIIDFPCGLPTRFDSRRDAGQCGIVWAIGREYERIPPGADGCECLILGPSKLLFPFPSVHGPSRVEPDPGKPVLLRERDLSRGYRRARTGDADDPLASGRPETLVAAIEQACGLPMSNQSISPDPANRRRRAAPRGFPTSGDRPRRASRRRATSIATISAPWARSSLQPSVGLAALQGEIIDETDVFFGLLREMAADIRLVHGRYRVAGHGRMPVEPVADAVRDGEQVAEGLVAPNRGVRDDERMPFAAETGTARSIARPIDPTCGAESKVEQTL